MSYVEEIVTYKNNPQKLEALYRSAHCKQEIGQFSADLDACFSGETENLLLQVWH